MGSEGMMGIIGRPANDKCTQSSKMGRVKKLWILEVDITSKMEGPLHLQLLHPQIQMAERAYQKCILT